MKNIVISHNELCDFFKSFIKEELEEGYEIYKLFVEEHIHLFLKDFEDDVIVKHFQIDRIVPYLYDLIEEKYKEDISSIKFSLFVTINEKVCMEILAKRHDE